MHMKNLPDSTIDLIPTGDPSLRSRMTFFGFFRGSLRFKSGNLNGKNNTD